MLQVQNLSKTFRQANLQIAALHDVSFTVKKSETIAIVGPSGSGKTTLLSLLAGLDSPSSGDILVNDLNIARMTEKELGVYRAQNVGIVFQQFHLMPHLTAIENVSLPLEIAKRHKADQMAEDILTRVGLAARLHHLPSQLSGGECQRVAIARAVVNKPKLLFADEPSGNLDHESGERVIQLLFDLVNEREMTLILVTHDLTLAARCDRQIQIMGGKMI